MLKKILCILLASLFSCVLFCSCDKNKNNNNEPSWNIESTEDSDASNTQGSSPEEETGKSEIPSDGGIWTDRYK